MLSNGYVTPHPPFGHLPLKGKAIIEVYYYKEVP